ncbi:MAG: OmpH family outer membrane protein [Dysgonamonadaceae bacterium]|jgi:outer membrane protein|nr:OmpH family outer membrane protein [Dysgonamonadaceae bacterium]
MLKKIVLLALLLAPVGVFAQDKIAYFNSVEVITAMPEYVQMQDSIQKKQEEFRKEMRILEEEYSKKYEAFLAEAEGLSEAIRNRRMTEIQDIEQRAAKYNEDSQTEIQQLYEQLLVPIQQKVRDALQKVGEENSFTYILDAGSTVVYVSPTAPDATPLVKTKLSLQ